MIVLSLDDFSAKEATWRITFYSSTSSIPLQSPNVHAIYLLQSFPHPFQAHALVACAAHRSWFSFLGCNRLFAGSAPKQADSDESTIEQRQYKRSAPQIFLVLSSPARSLCTMSSSSVPLRVPRLVSLSLTWAFAVMASGAGLNSLIKSDQSQSSLKSKVPPPAVVTIDISDVRTTGIIATVACLLIALLTSAFVFFLLFPIKFGSTSTPLSTRTLRLQWISLAFCALFLFSVQVPFTHYFATRAAVVRAFVGNVELPHSVIQTVEAQLGATSIYREIDYLRLTAVFPWIAFASLLVTIGITVAAIFSTRGLRTHPGSASSMVEKDSAFSGKGNDVAEQEMNEKV